MDGMASEEFVNICIRRFGKRRGDWKRPAAERLDRKWNTVWCYASGRRAIPGSIADEVRAWDRMMDEIEARLASLVPEGRRREFREAMRRANERWQSERD
jgi:hypothetical protein